MTRQTVTMTSFANHMPDVVAIRRHLHRHPETGLSEFKTRISLPNNCWRWGTR